MGADATLLQLRATSVFAHLLDPRGDPETAPAQRFARTGPLGRGRAALYDSATLVRFLAARLAGPDLFRTVLRVGGPPPGTR